MATYLLIESSSGIIRDTILWDGITEWNPPDGYYLELPTGSYSVVIDTSSYAPPELSTALYGGNFQGYFFGYVTGSITGSFTGSHLGDGTGSYTGSFTGSLQGTVSNSSTASYVSNIKSGKVTSGEWVVELVGNKYTASVLLSSSYSNDLYAVSLTCGADIRMLSVTDKTPSGFNINSNSTSAMTDDVYWVTVPYNNP